LDTEIASVPAVAISEAVIEAVSCVELKKVMARGCPLKFTVDIPEAKPVPVIVNEKAAPPTLALAGLNEVIVGAGLFAGSM
jgi:hypothetical protein